MTVALGDIAGAIRDGLLAFGCSAEMVIGQITAEEVTTKVDPKGRHDSGRVGHLHRHSASPVALGVQMVRVDRARANLTGGG